MNTVIAPTCLRRRTATRSRRRGTVGRNQVLRYFFQRSGRQPRAQGRLRRIRPAPRARVRRASCASTRTASAIDSNASTRCYAPPVGGLRDRATRYSRTVDGALAGRLGGDGRGQAHVGRRRRRRSRSRRRSSASTVTPNPDVIADAQVGVPVARGRTRPEQLRRRSPGGRSARRSAARGRGVFTIANRDAAGVHDDDPGRLDVVPRDDRRTVRPGCGPRPVRLQVPDSVGTCDAPRPECRRRLGGVGHDRQPGGRHLAGAGRRLRGPGGVDDVQLRRHLRQPGLGTVVGDRANALRPAGARGRLPAA